MANDVYLAKKYIQKAQNAANCGVDFDLSFMSYKNLMSAKKCGYTGIKLTTPRQNKQTRITDRTIDRIDSEKGYVSGNVVACCNYVNMFKSVIENPNNPLTMQSIKRMIVKLND